MGTSGSWPNYDAWLQNTWGSGQEFWTAGPGARIAAASNLVFGVNPPYYLDDFLAVYPAFFGPLTQVTGAATVAGGNQIAVPSLTGLAVGQFLQAAGLPPNTVITGLGATYVTVNNTAAVSASGVMLTVYESPVIPLFVIQLYLNLANSSLVQARWKEQWYIAMGLFICHYCTMWADSSPASLITALRNTLHGETPDGSGTVGAVTLTLSSAPPTGFISLFRNGLIQRPEGDDYSLNGAAITLGMPVQQDDIFWVQWTIQISVSTGASASQVAAAGLASGILTSKSVGDVSAGYTTLSSLEAWGAWNLTKAGQLLATMAKGAPGSGPMVIW
jgi:hypothetical protein